MLREQPARPKIGRNDFDATERRSAGRVRRGSSPPREARGAVVVEGVAPRVLAVVVGRRRRAGHAARGPPVAPVAPEAPEQVVERRGHLGPVDRARLLAAPEGPQALAVAVEARLAPEVEGERGRDDRRPFARGGDGGLERRARARAGPEVDVDDEDVGRRRAAPGHVAQPVHGVLLVGRRRADERDRGPSAGPRHRVDGRRHAPLLDGVLDVDGDGDVAGPALADGPQIPQALHGRLRHEGDAPRRAPLARRRFRARGGGGGGEQRDGAPADHGRHAIIGSPQNGYRRRP